MGRTVSGLATLLKGKEGEDRLYLIRDFVSSLTPQERKFYGETYQEIDKALNDTRHVTKALHLAIRRGAFIPDPNNFGLYYQIGCGIYDKPIITPVEAIRLMNEKDPRPRKKTKKDPRDAPIFDKESSPGFLGGRQRYPSSIDYDE